MFFIATCHRMIYLPAQDLGALFMRRIEHYLRQSVEGKRLPELGLVVAIKDILAGSDIEGKVLDSGEVAFLINYEALVFKLFPNEVVDVIVNNVQPEGFYASVGAATIFVDKLYMSEFAHENDGTSSMFVKADNTASISVGDIVRVKIVNETPTSAVMDAVATIDGAFLGPR